MTDENMDEHLEALESEKEEYLDEHPEEDVEVEEIEFSLSESEVDEWIGELTRLKEEKNPITLNVDPETDLKINFDESSDSEEDENDEDDDDDEAEEDEDSEEDFE